MEPRRFIPFDGTKIVMSRQKLWEAINLRGSRQ